jgi:hypothetical protein
MTKPNYSRLLEAVHIHSKRIGVSKADSSALDKVMTYPHPLRELAFVGWVLKDDLNDNIYRKHMTSKAKASQISL